MPPLAPLTENRSQLRIQPRNAGFTRTKAWSRQGKRRPASGRLGSWGTRIRTKPESALAGSKSGIDAQNDAQADPDLSRVVQAWSHLSPELRAAVLAVVAAAPPP